MLLWNIIVLLAILVPTLASDLFNQERRRLTKCSRKPEFECGKTTSSRIIGGGPAKPHEFPWQVSLTYKDYDQHFCGGTIIGHYHILTAAHCFFDDNDNRNVFANDFYVKVGEHNVESDDKEIKIGVDRIITHHGYNKGAYSNRDIAILLLKTSIQFNERAVPACLPTAKNSKYDGMKLMVSGWGDVKDGQSPSKLQHVDVVGVSLTRCRKKHPEYEITKFMLCAIGGGQSNGEIKDACAGDSGGPLVKTKNEKTTVVGVVSFGSNCTDHDGDPGVYTRVNMFRKWIIRTGVYQKGKPDPKMDDQCRY